MNNYKYSKKSIYTFFGIVIILSAIAEFLICRCGYMWAYPVLMWMPAVSAIIASIVSVKESGEQFSLKKLLHNTGFKFCNIKYIIIGILLPLMTCFTSDFLLKDADE